MILTVMLLKYCNIPSIKKSYFQARYKIQNHYTRPVVQYEKKENTFIHTPIAAHSVVVVLNMSNSNDIHVIKLYALKL